MASLTQSPPSCQVMVYSTKDSQVWAWVHKLTSGFYRPVRRFIGDKKWQSIGDDRADMKTAQEDLAEYALRQDLIRRPHHVGIPAFR